VNHFRSLDKIVQPAILCEKILEILPIVSLNTKKDLISALPDFIPDAQHKVRNPHFCLLLYFFKGTDGHLCFSKIITQGLVGHMADDQDVLAVTLDTLANLNIDIETMVRLSHNRPYFKP
jgi:hypothetical protein